jgi:methylated-DNA-[protein]-cysteine S-methyltransferase
MAVAVEVAAAGHVTTWAGTTHVVTSERGVRQIDLPAWRDDTRPRTMSAAEVAIEHGDGTPAGEYLRQALRELAEYFAGERRDFTVALDPQGPAFYQKAWAEVSRVPYGETRSYGEVARAIGSPAATRAVGAANGANPVAPFVPCHRIVGSDGRLTGYGPGLPLKRRLLAMEGAIPAGPEDYSAWLRRIAERRGGAPFYLGLRGANIACHPECTRELRRRYEPGRIFATLEEAEAAGFVPCPVCAS